jgi:2-pyrone-4,6-dicarboxylate lactonase
MNFKCLVKQKARTYKSETCVNTQNIQAAEQLCAAPQPFINPIKFNVPVGAVDTHAHVISSQMAFPMVANRSYTPPEATEEQYLAMLDGTRMTYGVLVQVSIYGTDNSCMLEVLKSHPERLRGIAVVSPDVSDQELEQLDAAGVRGLRINVLFKGGSNLDEMERLACRIKDLNWHIQLLMDVRHLPELMPRVRKLPVPLVFDHMGHMPVSEGVHSQGFESLRRLLVEGGHWVKLSAAYRLNNSVDSFDDVKPFARLLVADNPDRVLWGSDWPHVSQTRTPNTGDLLNLLPDWVPDAAIRDRILVDNPGRLYGFKTS